MDDASRPDLAMLQRVYAATVDRKLLFTLQAAALASIIRAPGMSTSGLAAALGTSRTAATRSVASLVEAGMVTNRIDPHDNRLRIIEPTATGRDTLEAIVTATFHPEAESHDP